MALALCLTLLPTAALAADGDHTAGNHDTSKFTKLWVDTDNDNKLMNGNVPWETSDIEIWSNSASERGYALTEGTYYLGSNLNFTNCNTAYAIMIVGDVTLCLNGHEIKNSTPDNECVIAVYAKDASTLTLTDCMGGGKITGGKKEGVDVRKGYTLNMHGGTITGGVDMSGHSEDSPTKFNMYGGTITGDGVGVRLTQYCTFTMSGGTISNNKGGVSTGGGEFTMSGGDITGSRATNGGGVNIGNGGKFEMSGTAKITGNTAAYAGGGVYVSGGTFIMNGGEIKSNTAETNGGGVYVTKAASSSISAFTMNGGEISGNTAKRTGGGVFVENGTFTVSGKPTVNNNTSGSAEGSKVTDNVYLYPNKTITIGNGLTGGTIGVTTGSATPPTGDSTVAITTSTPNANGYLDYFKSDNDSYDIVTNKQHTQLELKAKPKTELTSSNTKITITNTGGFAYSGQTITPTVKVTYTDPDTQQETVLTENDYTVSGNTGKDAGNYELTITGIGKYEGTVTKTWTITPLIVSVSSVTLNNKVYNGSKEGRISDVTRVEVKSGPSSNSVTLRSEDYEIDSVTYTDANASTSMQNVTIKVTLKNSNYTFAGSNKLTTTVSMQGKIVKAPAPQETIPHNLNVVNNKANTYTLNLSELLPKLTVGKFGNIGGYMLDAVNLGDYYDSSNSATINGSTLTLPIKAANTVNDGGQIGTVTVKVTTQNYEDITLIINIKAVAANKIVPIGTPTLSKTTLAWGEQLSTIALSGTMTDPTDSTKTVKGKFEWVTPGAAKEKIGEYQAEWKFTPTDTAVYAETSGKVTIKVIKATPKGAPGYTKITTTGKTLKDANLTVGTIQPEGTIQWERGDTTVVTANTAYKWVFTPKDTEHYDVLTGSITPYSVSSNTGGSSSGGGSSSDRDSYDSNPVIKTETKNNPDGSTTKTETRKDGSVTQTTTGKDGSVSKTETKKDGSSITENKAADGSTGTVKTDKNGQTEAKTALSNKAVEDAKRNGEAVKAPVEVEASRNSGTAPVVNIELPKGAGETKVEIPVSNANAGTVAVLVHPDGTEEILKDSIPTEDGIQLTVNGNATVKIVDNSKDFIDTQNHWAKDEIDFVSARELVNGISATRYAPDATATRAQLWTILARQNDTDLSGGANWYEKAQLWSKDKGISDGTNPNGTINRAQMVTMLWRTMGQPAATDKVSFADVPAGSYYAQAVAWAVESGITTGVGGGRFDPAATCTRAQIAAFLARSMK